MERQPHEDIVCCIHRLFLNNLSLPSILYTKMNTKITSCHLGLKKCYQNDRLQSKAVTLVPLSVSFETYYKLDVESRRSGVGFGVCSALNKGQGQK